MPHDRERTSWTAAFLKRQRIPPGSRLSAWLHGESALGHHSGDMSNHHSHFPPEKRPPRIATARSHHENYSPGLQSPLHFLQSPINFSRPLTPDVARSPEGTYVHPAFASPSPIEGIPKSQARAHAHKKRSKHHHKAPRAAFFKSKDPRVQCKSIGTFVSGTLLTIVLTVYLALAAANVVPTTAFHGTFIFIIILLTMIFAHFLVRLCMLTLRQQGPPRSRQSHHHRHHYRYRRDLESGRAPPSLPPVRLLDHHEEDEEPRRSRGSSDADKNLPAPPPAYGWWRGSVRIDPEDVRYNPDQSELQQQTRSLVFAGSGHQPPSYSSEPLDGHVARSAPLFHETRNIPRNDEVRDV